MTYIHRPHKHGLLRLCQAKHFVNILGISFFFTQKYKATFAKTKQSCLFLKHCILYWIAKLVTLSMVLTSYLNKYLIYEQSSYIIFKETSLKKCLCYETTTKFALGVQTGSSVTDNINCPVCATSIKWGLRNYIWGVLLWLRWLKTESIKRAWSSNFWSIGKERQLWYKRCQILLENMKQMFHFF